MWLTPVILNHDKNQSNRLIPTESDDFKFLAPQEVVDRVSKVFPAAIADWKKGNAIVEEGLQQHIANGTPEIILQGHRALIVNRQCCGYKAKFRDIRSIIVCRAKFSDRSFRRC